MARKKHQTNVEFVAQLMNYSQHGALAQLFILDAISKWSNKIASTRLEDLRKQFGPNAFVNPDAWHAVAVDLKRQLDERTA